MSSARPRPKASPRAIMVVEKVATRVSKRQELARMLAEKEQQMARVKAGQPGRNSEESSRQQDADGASLASSNTAEDRPAYPRVVRNKENQTPHQTRRPQSKQNPANRQSPQASSRRPSRDHLQPNRQARDQVQPKAVEHKAERQRTRAEESPRKASSRAPRHEDTQEIEDMYCFDLALVEQMLQKEASSEMEQMYSFDLSKVQQALGTHANDEQANAPDPQTLEGGCERASVDEVPIRARRRSAPMPDTRSKDVSGVCISANSIQPLGVSWQDAGLRKLASENRELKERAAKLESEFQRLQSLASGLPNPLRDGERMEFAEMD